MRPVARLTLALGLAGAGLWAVAVGGVHARGVDDARQAGPAGLTGPAASIGRPLSEAYPPGEPGAAAVARSLTPAALRMGVAPAMSEGGWQLDAIGGRRAAMRSGALPGVCTWFLTMPDDDVSVILLSNRTPGKPRCGMLAVEVTGLVTGAR